MKRENLSMNNGLRTCWWKETKPRKEDLAEGKEMKPGKQDSTKRKEKKPAKRDLAERKEKKPVIKKPNSGSNVF